jgi:hypothetical protein
MLAGAETAEARAYWLRQHSGACIAGAETAMAHAC